MAPSQNLAEAPYIANNLALTRRAFALDTWTLASDIGRSSLTAADVGNDQATFDNARLWDASPLSSTLDQLQSVRQYYTFTSVNIDRYVINGQPTEVMLSAREMALDNSQASPSWIAAHVLYTHGYGLAMVPVNAVDPNGLPHLIIQNLPVTQSAGAPVDLGPGRREEQRVRLPVQHGQRQRRRHPVHRGRRAAPGLAGRAAPLGLEPG